MIQIVKTEDVTIYQFPENSRSIGYNQAIIETNDCSIIVDSGYKEHFLQITDLLQNDVVCLHTHMHPDHYEGCIHNLHIESICSTLSCKELERFGQSIESFHVIQFIDKKTSIIDNLVQVYPVKGHSCDGLLYEYKNHLFVGDILIYDNKGSSILPYVGDSARDHIVSLERIKEMDQTITIVPSHGAIKSLHHLIHDIDMRIRYLTDFLLKMKPLDDEMTSYFKNPQWHINNMDNMK